MSVQKPPIPLDYKTPEKVEPITARMVISRVVSGFCGVLTLIVAVVFTTHGIRAVGNLMSRFTLEGIVSCARLPLSLMK